MSIEFALAMLATWRIARMIALEEGAFSIFVRLRQLLDPDLRQATWLARGINCPLCVGFWVALVFAVILDYPNITARELLLTWFALAGAQAVLHLLLDGRVE